MSQMASLCIGVLIGSLSGLLAKLVYSMVRTQWPEAYSFKYGVLERLQLRNIWSYLGLKILPLFLFGFLGVATCIQLGASALASIVSAFIVCVALTDAKALRNAYRYRDSRRGTLTVFYLASIVFSGFVACCALFAGVFGYFFAPTPEDLVAGFWTALFVAVVAFGVREVARLPAYGPQEKIALARRDMGNLVWNRIEELALENDVDPYLAQAITIVEVIQRPHWFRVAERVVGRFRKSATYGVAQVASDVPLSDSESLELLCRQLPSSADVFRAAEAEVGTSVGSPMESGECHTPRERFTQYEYYVMRRGATPGYVDEVRSIYCHLVAEQSVEEGGEGKLF